MEDNNALLRLKQNLEQLLKAYQETKKALLITTEKLTATEEKLLKATHSIEKLQQDYSSLKMAKSLENFSGVSEEYDAKITKIVSDIDTCIELLNR